MRMTPKSLCSIYHNRRVEIPHDQSLVLYYSACGPWGGNLANTIIQVVVGEPSCSQFASGLDGSEQARALRAAAHQEGKTMHIGFIGLGQMGAGMAANLVKAGQDVTVYHRARAN